MPKFLTYFYSEEVVHQKVTNFHRHLCFVKTNIQIKSGRRHNCWTQIRRTSPLVVFFIRILETIVMTVQRLANYKFSKYQSSDRMSATC